MSSNVQHQSKEVYLRTTEAAQCQAQSTIILPVFLDAKRAVVVAALEVVQTAEDLPFPFILASFAEILPVRSLQTAGAGWMRCAACGSGTPADRGCAGNAGAQLSSLAEDACTQECQLYTCEPHTVRSKNMAESDDIVRQQSARRRGSEVCRPPLCRQLLWLVGRPWHARAAVQLPTGAELRLGAWPGLSAAWHEKTLHRLPAQHASLPMLARLGASMCGRAAAEPCTRLQSDEEMDMLAKGDTAATSALPEPCHDSAGRPASELSSPDFGAVEQEAANLLGRNASPVRTRASKVSCSWRPADARRSRLSTAWCSRPAARQQRASNAMLCLRPDGPECVQEQVAKPEPQGSLPMAIKSRQPARAGSSQGHGSWPKSPIGPLPQDRGDWDDEEDMADGDEDAPSTGGAPPAAVQSQGLRCSLFVQSLGPCTSGNHATPGHETSAAQPSALDLSAIRRGSARHSSAMTPCAGSASCSGAHACCPGRRRVSAAAAAGPKRGGKGSGNPGKPGKRLQLADLQGQFGVGLKEAAARLGICPTTLKARRRPQLCQGSAASKKSSSASLCGGVQVQLSRLGCRAASPTAVPHLHCSGLHLWCLVGADRGHQQNCLTALVTHGACAACVSETWHSALAPAAAPQAEQGH